MVTLRELRKQAKSRGLRGYSRLRKSDLIDFLANPPVHYTVRELKQQARERGLRGYSRLRKAELIDLLLGKLVIKEPVKTTVKTGKLEDLKFVPMDHAVGKYLRSWRMDVDVDAKDQSAFLNDVKPIIMSKINEELSDLGSIKYQLAVKVNLSKSNSDRVEYTDPHLRNKQEVITESNAISSSLDHSFQVMQETLERFTHRGSGWSVDGVETLWLDIANYVPLKGGSYIDLPSYYKNKKAIVNVKNKDDDCLRWSLKSALFPVNESSDRPSSYPVDDGLDFEGINTPTPLSQIGKVEKQNNLAINVFGNTKGTKGVIVHRISSAPGRIINLFMIEKDDKYHYTWIKNFNRLMYDQTTHKEKKYFCQRCLHGYCREDLLEAHKEDCKGVGQTAIRIDMPQEGKNKLSFQNYQNKMAVPYIIYADFESLNRKVESVVVPSSDKSYTYATQKHEACGYGYVVVRYDGETDAPVVYRGANAADKFLEALQKEENRIRKQLANKTPLRMTKDDWRSFKKAETCWICHKPLKGQYLKNGDIDRRVRDHCHITGKYRGAAHMSCNLKLKINPEEVIIPIVFHNLRGYDSHIIMQAISKVEGQIKCIPNNMEKYISFSLGKLRFIDSVQFMLSSLDSLVEC